ncbi:MAG: dephospho-CoA kinase [Desulfobacterales bacterium]|nr:dephospho-CoA kinase [Desulfobacterales bacterium]MDD3950615.1 dephospho-CoA kinase [Desulfobacterales bacterium]MDD4463219.1 dephospho-CoA kinase [Desulfobacterales bacterium]
MNTSAVTIAVTGGAGSGKSLVCNRFRDLGAAVIDCDELAREAVAPGSSAYQRIVAYFGKSVVCADGALNRRQLRRKIVSDNSARSALNGFVHPEIIRLMQERMAHAETAGNEMIVVEVPLLFELGLEDRFDAVIVVSVSTEAQLQRLADRDHISLDQARALTDTQMPDAQKRRKAMFLIENNGSVEDLIRAVDAVYKKFCQKKTKKTESA